MRHYEIVFIVHPDQSEQVAADGRALQGRDRGQERRGPPPRGTGAGASSTYPIQKIHKGAFNVLMNIECDNETLAELEHSVSSSATRCYATSSSRCRKAWTAPSPMMREEKSKSMIERGAERGAEPRAAEGRPADAAA